VKEIPKWERAKKKQRTERGTGGEKEEKVGSFRVLDGGKNRPQKSRKEK